MVVKPSPESPFPGDVIPFSGGEAWLVSGRVGRVDLMGDLRLMNSFLSSKMERAGPT